MKKIKIRSVRLRKIADGLEDSYLKISAILALPIWWKILKFFIEFVEAL